MSDVVIDDDESSRRCHHRESCDHDDHTPTAKDRVANGHVASPAPSAGQARPSSSYVLLGRHLGRLRAFLAPPLRPAWRAVRRSSRPRLRPRDRRPHRARGDALLKLVARRHLAPRRSGRVRERVSLPTRRVRPRWRASSRRRRLPLDLQPHRAVPRRRARRRAPRASRGSREPLDAGRLPAARRGGGHSSLPRRGRARLAGARRGRDPRPGARRVRGGEHRAAARRLFRQALQMGKRVRSRRRSARAPHPCRRPPPRSRSRCSATSGRRVLLIGAGRDRRARGREPLGPRRRDRVVVNRSPARPRRLRPGSTRGRSPGRAASRARRGRRRARVDERARRSSSARPTCRSRRPARPLFFIDIAVPRDIDPAVHELDGCYLYDIDDLEAVVAETIAGRRARPRARRSSSSRRPSASASGRRRSRSCRRSRRCAPAPRRSARPSSRSSDDLPERRAAHDRVGHGADPEQAAAPADRAA